ncbi:MAG: hypothetical protein KDB82_09785 [Planctomycetes bacterium]|nr:hypothetical protein [Planctomycetota bacterium]
MSKCLPLITIALLLAACGPSAEELIEQRRAEAEPKLKQIEDAGKLAVTYTGEPSDISLPDGGKLNFTQGGNAALVQVEQFAEGDARKPQLDLILDEHWLVNSRKLLSEGPGSMAPEAVSGTFDRLLAIKYIAFVRTTLYADPVVMGEGSFSPGFWQGDVMVFELEGGKCLGRIELSAKNSDAVNVDKSKADTWLHSDLWSRARDALVKALEPHTDGKVLK